MNTTNAKGFTLLEVLVSLALLGIAVTAILQLFTADMKAIAASENYVAGSLEAQSKIREVLDNKDLDERRWGGVTDNGYRYEVSVREVLAERTETLQMKLMEVEVKVFWTQGRKDRSLTLKTMKTVKKPI